LGNTRSRHYVDLPFPVAAHFGCLVHRVARGALEIKIKSPGATIRIPDLEAFKLGVHPKNAAQPAAKLLGEKNGVTVSVLTQLLMQTPLRAQCASWAAGQVLFRFAPPLETVQFVRVGESAYVLVFPLKVAGAEQLKAFIVSGNGKGHCIEVHASRWVPPSNSARSGLPGSRACALKCNNARLTPNNAFEGGRAKKRRAAQRER